MSKVFTAGDTVQLELTVTRDGAPVDLTGMSIRFAIADSTGTIASTEDSGSDITVTVTDAAAGKYVVRMEPTLTSTLRGTYRYQSEIEDGSGGIATVASRYITFTRDLIPLVAS